LITSAVARAMPTAYSSSPAPSPTNCGTWPKLTAMVPTLSFDVCSLALLIERAQRALVAAANLYSAASGSMGGAIGPPDAVRTQQRMRIANVSAASRLS
jgi:hypothetical protein